MKYLSHPPMPKGLHLKTKTMGEDDVAESIVSRLESESCPANFYIDIGVERPSGNEGLGVSSGEGAVEKALMERPRRTW